MHESRCGRGAGCHTHPAVSDSCRSKRHPVHQIRWPLRKSEDNSRGDYGGYRPGVCARTGNMHPRKSDASVFRAAIPHPYLLILQLVIANASRFFGFFSEPKWNQPVHNSWPPRFASTSAGNHAKKGELWLMPFPISESPTNPRSQHAASDNSDSYGLNQPSC